MRWDKGGSYDSTTHTSHESVDSRSSGVDSWTCDCQGECRPRASAGTCGLWRDGDEVDMMQSGREGERENAQGVGSRRSMENESRTGDEGAGEVEA